MPHSMAVTLGDPGGIGPEVTLKALSRFRKDPMLRRTSVVLVGPEGLFASVRRRLRLNLKWISQKTLRRPLPAGIHLFDLPLSHIKPISGKISAGNARLAYASLAMAAYLAVHRVVDAVVTAPVNKEAMRLVDRRFIGHTEFLAAAAGIRRYAMMFDTPALKVTLVTIHLPLKEVSRRLKASDILEKIALTNEYLKKHYRLRRPRIAVAALNPHGSEFGREEKGKIVPAVKAARRRGIHAAGPLPGDTVFYECIQGSFDAVVAMYHDQGLAPLKALDFARAVNLTLGLPFVRTSPDHGTAYDKAGRNQADPSSMLSAIRLAARLVR